MNLIAECEYCGQKFSQENNCEFREECVLHEAEHLNIKERFQIILEKAIITLNKKYNLQTYCEYKDIKIKPDYDQCCDCLHDELSGVACTTYIYFDKNTKSYISFSVDFISMEYDLDINELIKIIEYNYKRYINGKLKPKKKFRYEYNFDKIFVSPEEFKNTKFVFIDENVFKKGLELIRENKIQCKDERVWIIENMDMIKKLL